MLSINTNSAYTYGCQTAAYRRPNIQKTFAGTVNQQLTPPSVDKVYNICNFAYICFGAISCSYRQH